MANNFHKSPVASPLAINDDYPIATSLFGPCSSHSNSKQPFPLLLQKSKLKFGGVRYS